MKNKFTSSLNDFLTAVMYADDRSAVYFPPTFIGALRNEFRDRTV